MGRFWGRELENIFFILLSIGYLDKWRTGRTRTHEQNGVSEKLALVVRYALTKYNAHIARIII